MIYLGVICGLIGWIWADGERKELYNRLLFTDLKQIDQIQDKYIFFLKTQIEKNTPDYENEKDVLYREQAAQARKELDLFNKKAYNILNENWVANSGKWFQDSKNMDDPNRPASIEELRILKIAAQNLCDSLIGYTDYDQIAADNIRYLLAPDLNLIFWNIAKTAKPYQSAVLLKDLMLKANLACITTLNHIASKTSPGIIENWFRPNVSAEKSAILPGQTYKAVIFLSQYSQFTRNTTIKVNGKPYPIKDGIVYFSQRYTTPGEKKYRVDIEIKNPWTNHIETKSKEFNLLVVDSCR